MDKSTPGSAALHTCTSDPQQPCEPCTAAYLRIKRDIDTTAACEHDWRMNPFFCTASHPAQAIVQCANCGVVRYEPLRAFAYPLPQPDDVKSWPTWEDR